MGILGDQLNARYFGKVTFKALPGLAAYASFGDPVQYENGTYKLDFDASLGTYWIVFRDAS